MNAHSLLSARGIRKTFGQFVALNNIDFDLPAGEKHALIGPNGAGKSTFIACIAGQLPGVEGTVLFKGDDITKATPVDLARRGIGRTFQISRAFLDMSVLENLTSAFVIANGGGLLDCGVGFLRGDVFGTGSVGGGVMTRGGATVVS